MGDRQEKGQTEGRRVVHGRPQAGRQEVWEREKAWWEGQGTGSLPVPVSTVPPSPGLSQHNNVQTPCLSHHHPPSSPILSLPLHLSSPFQKDEFYFKTYIRERERRSRRSPSRHVCVCVKRHVCRGRKMWQRQKGKQKCMF